MKKSRILFTAYLTLCTALLFHVGASAYIDRIEGCYYNVVGLPLARLKKLLGETMDKEATR